MGSTEEIDFPHLEEVHSLVRGHINRLHVNAHREEEVAEEEEVEWNLEGQGHRNEKEEEGRHGTLHPVLGFL